MKDSYKKEKKQLKRGAKTFLEDLPSEREWDSEPKRELLNPKIKGLFNFYPSSEKRKPTNSSHRDLLTT